MSENEKSLNKDSICVDLGDIVYPVGGQLKSYFYGLLGFMISNCNFLGQNCKNETNITSAFNKRVNIVEVYPVSSFNPNNYTSPLITHYDSLSYIALGQQFHKSELLRFNRNQV